MASQALILALAAAFLIFTWHVFVIMQITPRVADFLEEDYTETAELPVVPDSPTEETTAMRHYKAANLMLEDLNENFDRYNPRDKYRLAFLTKQHLDVVHQEIEGNGSKAEADINRARQKMGGFLNKLEPR